jgi:hypothetical protein
MEVFQWCGKEQTNPWSRCTTTSWTMQVYDMPKLLTSTLLATGGVGGNRGGPALTTWPLLRPAQSWWEASKIYWRPSS